LSERLRLWLERGESGYHLRDASSRQRVDWNDARFQVVALAGASFRSEQLQHESFAPGRRLALVPEPENEHDPNAVGIWNEARTVQAGYVPRELAAGLVGDEQAVSLWEFVEEGRRIGLRVLILPAGAWVGRPR
jgi:HIRAN domain